VKVYNELKNKMEQGKRWMLRKAIQRVVAHYSPGIMSAIAGMVAAHNFGFIELRDDMVCIHIAEGLHYVLALMVGIPVSIGMGVGVVANKDKFERKKAEKLKEATKTDDDTDRDVAGLFEDGVN